jgi:hypothetical protein
MNADTMHEIAEQARQTQKAEQKLKEQNAVEVQDAWWRAHGYPTLMRCIKQAALDGQNSYSGLYSYGCPEFVLANLRCMGFEITTGLKYRGPRKPSHQVLKVEW